MELKEFQTAIDNVKSRKNEVDMLTKQLSDATANYQDAIENVRKMREQFNQELDSKLEGIVPDAAPKHIIVR